MKRCLRFCLRAALRIPWLALLPPALGLLLGWEASAALGALARRTGTPEGYAALALALEEERAEGRARQRTVLLAHLSQENNFPEMAMATMSNILEERGLLSAGLTIRILPRTEQSPVYTV